MTKKRASKKTVRLTRKQKVQQEHASSSSAALNHAAPTTSVLASGGITTSNNDVFAEVTGRLSLFGTDIYAVTRGEVQRRLEHPESLNQTTLNAMLRKSKGKEENGDLHEKLTACEMNAPQRKAVQNTSFTALTEGESNDLVNDFRTFNDDYFYAKDLAYESLARAKTRAEQTMRLIDAISCRRTIFFFWQSFDRIQGPEGLASITSRYGPEAKRLLDSFDRLSHGLGIKSKKAVFELQIRTMNEYIKAFSDPVTFCKELGRPLPQAARRILRLQGKGYVPPDLQSQETETPIKQEKKKLLKKTLDNEKQIKEKTSPKVMKSISCRQLKEPKSVDENKLPSPDLKLIKSSTSSEQIKQSTNNLSIDTQQIAQISTTSQTPSKPQAAVQPITAIARQPSTSSITCAQHQPPIENQIPSSSMATKRTATQMNASQVHELMAHNFNPRFNLFNPIFASWWQTNAFPTQVPSFFNPLTQELFKAQWNYLQMLSQAHSTGQSLKDKLSSKD